MLFGMCTMLPAEVLSSQRCQDSCSLYMGQCHKTSLVTIVHKLILLMFICIYKIPNSIMLNYVNMYLLCMSRLGVPMSKIEFYWFFYKVLPLFLRKLEDSA